MRRRPPPGPPTWGLRYGHAAVRAVQHPGEVGEPQPLGLGLALFHGLG